MNHCHPTICFWAEQLAKGQSIVYEGDPLLDFGIGNFLDRISYKNPKSSDDTIKHRKRMAQYEQPVNTLNFREGEEPENARLEEQFMYKYLQMRPEKSNKARRSDLEDANTGEDDEFDNIDNDADSDAEDPELESFVN